MKLSVSLTEDDVATLDAYVQSARLPSRSAAVQQAIRSLRLADLERDYEQAWTEWSSSGDEALWEQTVRDGLG